MHIEQIVGHFVQEDYKTGLEELKQLHEKEPHNQAAHFLLGYARRKMGELAPAQHHFWLIISAQSVSEKLRIVSKYCWALTLINLAYSNPTNDQPYFKLALFLIEDLLTSKLSDKYERFNKACRSLKLLILKESGRYEEVIGLSTATDFLVEARSNFKLGLKVKPSKNINYFYQKGIRLCEIGLILEPENATLEYYLSYGHSLMQDLPRAIHHGYQAKMLWREEKIGPEKPLTLENINYQINHFEEKATKVVKQTTPPELALNYFKKLLESGSYKFEFFQGKAQALWQLQRYEEAILTYRDALDIVDQNIEVRLSSYDYYQDPSFRDYYRTESHASILKILTDLMPKQSAVYPALPLDDAAEESGFNQPPLVLALLNGRFAVSLSLILEDANPNKAGDDGFNALHAVLSYPFSKKSALQVKILIRFILANKSLNIHALTKTGESAMAIAVRNRHEFSILEMLSKAGAKVSETGDVEVKARTIARVSAPTYSALHQAVLTKSVHLPFLMGQANLNSRNPETGDTALHLAATNGYFSIIPALLLYGASVAVQDHEEKTPLNRLSAVADFPPSLLLNFYQYGTPISECKFADSSPHHDFLQTSHSVVSRLTDLLTEDPESKAISATHYLGAQSSMLRFQMSAGKNFLIRIPSHRAILDENYPLTWATLDLLEDINKAIIGHSQFLPHIYLSLGQRQRLIEILAAHELIKSGLALEFKMIDSITSYEREVGTLSAEQVDNFKKILYEGIAILPELSDALTLGYESSNPRAWCESNGKSLPKIADVFLEIARALAILHNAGFVHLDLNPGNVLLPVKLIDFGKAQRLDENGRIQPVATTEGMQSAALRRHRRYKTKLLGRSEDYFQFAVLLLEVISENITRQDTLLSSIDRVERGPEQLSKRLAQFIRHIVSAREEDREAIDLVATFEGLLTASTEFKPVYKTNQFVFQNPRVENGRIRFDLQTESFATQFFQDLLKNRDRYTQDGQSIVLILHDRATLTLILNRIADCFGNPEHFRLMQPLREYILLRADGDSIRDFFSDKKLEKIISALNVLFILMYSSTETTFHEVLAKLPVTVQEKVTELRSKLAIAFHATLNNFRHESNQLLQGKIEQAKAEHALLSARKQYLDTAAGDSDKAVRAELCKKIAVLDSLIEKLQKQLSSDSVAPRASYSATELSLPELVELGALESKVEVSVASPAKPGVAAAASPSKKSGMVSSSPSKSIVTLFNGRMAAQQLQKTLASVGIFLSAGSPL